jgi:hypothetical protein
VSTLSQSIPQGKIVLTYDDYCLLPNDGNRYEILDGEFSVTPAPATKHQTVLGNLYRFLANHVTANSLENFLLRPQTSSLLPQRSSNLISSSSTMIAAISLQSAPSKARHLSLSRFSHPRLIASTA